MAIKLVYYIILIYPLNVFSQGKSFFLEPLIDNQFGTKSKYEFQKQELDNVEFLSLSKLGNIGYNLISFGLGAGIKTNKSAFSFVYKSICTTNGYTYVYIPNNNILQAQYYRLKVDSKRQLFSVLYSYELEKFKKQIHAFSIGYGLSFNHSTDISPNKMLNGNLVSIDSVDFQTKQKIGGHLSFTYTVSFFTKKRSNLFDLSLGYSQGLRNVDVLYIRQDDYIGNQNYILSKSRGSHFSIALSRKFHFKIN
jgi:hypothetical protein